jgi:hypothetical protein
MQRRGLSWRLRATRPPLRDEPAERHDEQVRRAGLYPHLRPSRTQTTHSAAAASANLAASHPRPDPPAYRQPRGTMTVDSPR